MRSHTIKDEASWRKSDGSCVYEASDTRVENEIRKLGTVTSMRLKILKYFRKICILKNQHDDLVEAEQTLMQIIDELDVMRKQFAEQFLKIKEEFNTVFRQLFGVVANIGVDGRWGYFGGGIRIIAQPPGKNFKYDAAFRRKSVDGNFFIICDPEFKTVAVLSSWWLKRRWMIITWPALHNICINWRKYAVYRNYASWGTMTAADRLYGITMQEKAFQRLFQFGR